MELNIILFENQKITTVLDNKNELWFKIKDIVNILGYENINQAMHVINPKDKNTFNKLKQVLNNSSKSNIFDKKKSNTYVNESGLCSLILFSKKDTGDKFKNWLINKFYINLKI